MQTGSLKPMIFEDLTEVYREEKNKGLLTEVRSDLYSAMSRLLVTLRDDYDRLLSLYANFAARSSAENLPSWC